MFLITPSRTRLLGEPRRSDPGARGVRQGLHRSWCPTAGSPGDATIGDCDSIEVEAKAIPFDFYALIDRSQAMQDPDFDKWELLVTSFTRFLQSGVANGTGFGVGFFPMGNPDDMCRNEPRPCFRGGCDPNMYANARVEIRDLPDNYQPLQMAIFQQPAGGPTLTRPALQGSLAHAATLGVLASRAARRADPDHRWPAELPTLASPTA